MNNKVLAQVFTQLQSLSQQIESHLNNFIFTVDIDFYFNEESKNKIYDNSGIVYDILNDRDCVLQEGYIYDITHGILYLNSFNNILNAFDFLNEFNGYFKWDCYKIRETLDDTDCDEDCLFFDELELIKPAKKIGEIHQKGKKSYEYIPLTVNLIKKLLKFKGSEFEQELEKWFLLYISKDKSNQEIAKQILKNIK